MEPHGQSPWYLAQRARGATLPVWRRDRPAYDGVFLVPVCIGGSPTAGMNNGPTNEAHRP